MNFSVSECAIYTAQKVLIYGPEGIGKTTLARKFPDPVFIDTEESSKGYVVKRITRPDGGVRPTSWTMLTDMVKAVRDGFVQAKTLVIDSLDWSESLCIQSICDKNKKDGIEDFGYGKGYTYLEEDFGKLLNLLSEVIEKGIHVVCTAHAAMRRVELPEETGAYDHWELKLEKKTAALVKEWADMILFCNYQTIVVKGNNPMEKNKAAGGKRMMHTTYSPWWDAKNRHELPDDLPMDFASIAHIFNVPLTGAVPPAQTVSTPAPAVQETPVPFYDSSEEPPEEFTRPATPAPAGIPKSLADLMAMDGITEAQVQKVVAKKGYYPEGTPIKNYDPQFISGCLVACWDKVKAEIT